VGIEATGHSQWFGQLLAQCGRELWVGDAAEIRASVVRQQKTDTHAMPNTCFGYWGKEDFRGSGFRRWKSAMYASCWCIARSWWA
jgi:hypothetical protein